MVKIAEQCHRPIRGVGPIGPARAIIGASLHELRVASAVFARGADMTEGRGWRSTVLGWFIVRQDNSAAVRSQTDAGVPSTPADGSEAAGPAPDVFQTAPPPAPAGRVNFDGVFDAGGIAATDRERVGKAAELLAGLPSETPVALRKQIVEASLKAFGVPLDKIIETAVEQIQALEGYIRAGAADADRLLAESNERIQQLETEIQNVRTVMTERVHEQERVAS